MSDDKLGGNFTFNDGESGNRQEVVKVTGSNRSKEINRRIVSDGAKRAAKDMGAEMWDTDPETLKQWAEVIVAQAFIDTLAKDASAVDWHINGDGPVDTDDIVAWINSLHPDMTFSDLVEATVRDILRAGNSFWGIHRDNRNMASEVVIPDINTMYIVKDEYGVVAGYIQSRSRKDNTELDKDDVVHFSWGSDASRTYAKGPTEMSLDALEEIQELIEMEILELKEGMPSGLLTYTDGNSDMPLSQKEYSNIQDGIHNDAGNQHKIGTAVGKWDFVDFSHGWDGEDLDTRFYRYVNTIGAAFKVNPSYVGFNADGLNRATDESQADNYNKRGLNVVLSQLEARINKDLIQPEFGDEYEFTFEYGSSDSGMVSYYQELAEASYRLTEAGIPHRIVNDKLEVDEDVVPAPELSDVGVDDSNTELEFESVESYTYRQQEVVDAFDGKPLAEILTEVEKNNRTRNAAFKEVRDSISGSLSKSTYQDWISQVGLIE